MANPNTVVRDFRRRRMVLLEERVFVEAARADEYADEARRAWAKSVPLSRLMVRVTRFRVGRRYNYAVRTYETREG